jgi:hypothetical protein
MNVMATPSFIGLPRELGGVTIPDSKLAQAAALLAWEAYPQFLYNHALRTYVFVSLQLLRLQKTYDAELAFVACALHDVGLTSHYVSVSASRSTARMRQRCF